MSPLVRHSRPAALRPPLAKPRVRCLRLPEKNGRDIPPKQKRRASRGVSNSRYSVTAPLQLGPLLLAPQATGLNPTAAPG